MTAEKLVDIAEEIVEELDGAKHYLKHAIHCKSKSSDIAKMYYEMGVQEMEHAQKLCEIGKKMADDSNEDELIHMWELSRGMVQNGIVEIKVMQEMYKA